VGQCRTRARLREPEGLSHRVNLPEWLYGRQGAPEPRRRNTLRRLVGLPPRSEAPYIPRDRAHVTILEESCWSNDFKAHSDKQRRICPLNANGNFGLSERQFQPVVAPIPILADGEVKRLVALAQTGRRRGEHVGREGGYGMMFPGPCLSTVAPPPNAEWLARQLTDACGWDEPPRHLIRDRDGAYGAAFIRRIRAMGIRDRPVSARSPWQNG
jgi:hypothetical protein